MPTHYSSKINEKKIKDAIALGKISQKQASGLSEGLLLGIIKKKTGASGSSKPKGGTKEERNKLGKQAHKAGRPKKGSKEEISK